MLISVTHKHVHADGWLSRRALKWFGWSFWGFLLLGLISLHLGHRPYGAALLSQRERERETASGPAAPTQNLLKNSPSIHAHHPKGSLQRQADPIHIQLKWRRGIKTIQGSSLKRFRRKLLVYDHNLS